MLTPAQEAFLEMTHPEPNSGCWLWIGSAVGFGYGKVDRGYALHRKIGRGLSTTAHRMAFQLFRGKIPKGKFILHKCDTAPCVNPDHLFVGTQADNMRDMVAKGRDRNGERPKGEQVFSAKLTDKIVEFIRTSKESAYALGPKLGVSHYTIRSVRHRRTWKHLP